MTDPNLTVALRLGEHGMATFPCRSDNKRPAMADWDGRSTTDAATITRLWAERPGALPGIDLRKAGLFALDGDRHHADVDGVHALRRIVREHQIDMRHVPIVHTPGNGVHLYFRNTAELGNKKGSLPAGVDVRGAGGYTIAPGSTLPDGRCYRPAGPDLLSAVKANTVPPIPQAVLEIIQRPRFVAPEIRPANHPSPSSNDRRSLAYAKAALAGCTSDLAAMPKDSGRNIALNGIAYRLGRMIANGWLGSGEVVDRLREAARACGLMADDGTRSVEATIRSGLTAGLRKPHPGLPP
jgi:hypothetical protein